MVKRFQAQTFDDGDVQEFEAVPAASYDAIAADLKSAAVLLEDRNRRIAVLEARLAALQVARDILSDIADHPSNLKLPTHIREAMLAYFTEEENRNKTAIAPSSAGLPSPVPRGSLSNSLGASSETGAKQVGCENEDGTLNIHATNETCVVCREGQGETLSTCRHGHIVGDGWECTYCLADQRTQSKTAAETPVQHTTEEDFQHWLSYTGYRGFQEDAAHAIREAYYAGAGIAYEPKTGEEP